MADTSVSYKNYTNICGTEFQPYVAKQIEARKSLVLKDPRTNSDLQWLNNKSSWIRISSGVDVDQDNARFLEKGDKLAKKYILQAGLTDHTSKDGSFNLREGFGSDGAYGIGGNDFGQRPMPGVTNLSIQTGGKLGTLREANIDFVCYNKGQLDIMDALYMKLGMSMLIEWGHTPFINNQGVLQTIPLPMDFFGVPDKEALMNEIQTKRVYHDGNYDAMWGIIKNWSFSLQDNGTFKCTVSLVGAGDVLESLKINQSGRPTSNSDTGSIYPVVADANKSYLNNALYYLWNNLEGLGAGESFIGRDYFKSLEQYFSNLDIKLISDNETTNIFDLNTPLIKSGFQFSIISGLQNTTSNNGIIPEIDPTLFFQGVNIPYEINGTKSTENPTSQDQQGLSQIYLTLGNLLLLIMSTGNLFDKNGSNKKPYIYIDVNTETNRCYTFPGHCSLDPTVCLIGSEKLPFGIQSEMFTNILKVNAPFYDDKGLGGRFMYTLVNINHVAKLMSNLSSNDPKGDVYIVDFLQELLKSISKACGGFNDFRIVPDDDTRCIRIFDDKRTTPPITNSSIEPYTVIPVLGKGSLAYNFNYTSKISPNTAAMIVISSQAEPTGVNISNEALAFSKLREGLTNRLAVVRVDSTDISPTKKETPEEKKQREDEEKLASDAKYQELRDLIINIYDGTGGGITESEAKAQKEAQKEELQRFD